MGSGFFSREYFNHTNTHELVGLSYILKFINIRQKTKEKEKSTTFIEKNTLVAGTCIK